MKDRVFAIGASLNGISALIEIVRNLPADFRAPVLIVQHVAAHSPGALPHILSNVGPLPAVHPKDREELRPGVIFVAPPDRHMLLVERHIRLSHGPKENMSRPAIDPLFRSVAATCGPAAVGVVLTGQLDDGTAGLLAIKDRGGVAVVQDPLEASAPSMPWSALRHVVVDRRCRVAEMPSFFVELANDAPGAEPPAPSRLLEIENRIALGVSTVDDWWDLEKASKPAGLSCPDCRSALYEIHDERMLRFRCRSGHGYSAENLLSAQDHSREDLLAWIFASLLEQATLASRLCQIAQREGDALRVTYLSERAARLQAEAEQIGAWMRATTGLIEPEPTPTPVPRPPRRATERSTSDSRAITNTPRSSEATSSRRLRPTPG